MGIADDERMDSNVQRANKRVRQLESSLAAATAAIRGNVSEIARLVERAQVLESELESSNKCHRSIQAALRGEAHADYCTIQIADGICSCPMSLASDLANAKAKRKLGQEVIEIQKQQLAARNEEIRELRGALESAKPPAELVEQVARLEAELAAARQEIERLSKVWANVLNPECIHGCQYENLQSDNACLREGLRKLEWCGQGQIGNHIWHYCLACHEEFNRPHRPDCWIEELLK